MMKIGSLCFTCIWSFTFNLIIHWNRITSYICHWHFNIGPIYHWLNNFKPFSDKCANMGRYCCHENNLDVLSIIIILLSTKEFFFSIFKWSRFIYMKTSEVALKCMDPTASPQINNNHMNTCIQYHFAFILTFPMKNPDSNTFLLLTFSHSTTI